MSLAIWFLPHGECPRRAVSKGGAFGRSLQGAKFPVLDLLGAASCIGGTTTPPYAFRVPISLLSEKMAYYLVFFGFSLSEHDMKKKGLFRYIAAI